MSLEIKEKEQSLSDCDKELCEISLMCEDMIIQFNKERKKFRKQIYKLEEKLKLYENKENISNTINNTINNIVLNV